MDKRVYNQEQAAEVLGTTVTTLGRRRRNGTIRPDLLVETQRAKTGLGRVEVLFDADLVDAIARGEERFDVQPEVAV